MSWLGVSTRTIVDILVDLDRHSNVEWLEKAGSFEASCPAVDVWPRR